MVSKLKVVLPSFMRVIYARCSCPFVVLNDPSTTVYAEVVTAPALALFL